METTWVFWSKCSFFINRKRPWNDSIIWEKKLALARLLMKYLYRNINQQGTKETWEETSMRKEWHWISSKGRKGNYIIKKSMLKRKSSTRIQYLLSDQMLPKCSGICVFMTQQMTQQMKVTAMVQRVSQHLWRVMKILSLMILSLEIFKTASLIWQQ